jgi:hypothetical protein
MPYARISVRPLHSACVRLPPPTQGGLTRQPAVVRLNVGIVFHHLQPPIRSQQPLDVLHVRSPSTGLDTLCNEAGMNDVVCVPLEHDGIVKPVVEIVSEEIEVIRLIGK